MIRIMRISSTVESALHTCVVLAAVPAGGSLSVGRLAEFHDLAPASLAKQLQLLTAANVLSGSTGRAGGYRLARPTTEITVLDVVLAVDGPEPGFRCAEIRRNGPCSGASMRYSARCAIARVMDDAEAAWRASLAARSLADVCGSLARQLDPRIAVAAEAWIDQRQRTPT